MCITASCPPSGASRGSRDNIVAATIKDWVRVFEFRLREPQHWSRYVENTESTAEPGSRVYSYYLILGKVTNLTRKAHNSCFQEISDMRKTLTALRN